MSGFEASSGKYPDGLDRLLGALDDIGSSLATMNQLEQYLAERGADPDEAADGTNEQELYIANHPEYEAAVQGEFMTLILAVEAIINHRKAQETTASVHRTLENEASNLQSEADQISQLSDITTADFPTNN